MSPARPVLAGLIAAAAGFAATPASATVEIFLSPGVLQPRENVLFQGQSLSATQLTGITNRTGSEVLFSGDAKLDTRGRGQAGVLAARGATLTTLSFGLKDDALGFGEVEFNLLGRAGQFANVTFGTADGQTVSRSFTIGNGQNFVSARTSGSNLFKSVTISARGALQEVRQVRLGAIPKVDFNPAGLGNAASGGMAGDVPEPSTWAMLIAGFGLVGGRLRRRRHAAA